MNLSQFLKVHFINSSFSATLSDIIDKPFQSKQQSINLTSERPARIIFAGFLSSLTKIHSLNVTFEDIPDTPFIKILFLVISCGDI